jgi:outer membrane immunogenic protein
MNRIFLLGSVATLALSSSQALAADSGAYIGLSAGYSNTEVDVSGTGALAGTLSEDIKGGELGVVAGYRHYVTDSFFVGGEGEATWSDADWEVSAGGVTVEAEKKYSLGLAIKPGYQFTDKFAVFGTLGWKWSEYELSAAGVSDGDTFDGLSYGGGVEYAVSDKISVGAEYTRVNLGKQTYDYGGGDTFTFDGDENVVKATVTYHF